MLQLEVDPLVLDERADYGGTLTTSLFLRFEALGLGSLLLNLVLDTANQFVGVGLGRSGSLLESRLGFDDGGLGLTQRVILDSCSRIGTSESDAAVCRPLDWNATYKACGRGRRNQQDRPEEGWSD
jgi:hypothetical protein